MFQDRYETVVQVDDLAVAGQQQWAEYASGAVEWPEEPYVQPQVGYDQRQYYSRVEYEYGVAGPVQEMPHGIIPKQEAYEYEYIDTSDIWQQDADGNYVATAPMHHYHQPHHHHSHSYHQ